MTTIAEMIKTTKQIKEGMSKAFFACAYADQWEESEDKTLNPSGCDWMNLIPDEIDSAAVHAADVLTIGMMHKNQDNPKCHSLVGNFATLSSIYNFALQIQEELGENNSNKELTPELFGHYCAMQAMGAGVGLESFGKSVRDAIKVPYVEFGPYSLSKDYF